MDSIRVAGGRPLQGTVRIGGAKNAVLPAMAAALLTEETVIVNNVPDVWDVGTMRRLLAEMGVGVGTPSSSRLELQARELISCEAPYRRVKTMRASVLALGPLLARFGRAHVSLPGGCAIGARPIDLHLHGLAKLGAEIELEGGFVDARAPRGLSGAHVEFENVTVTGTENLLMAATLARGSTVLENCAKEPEIVDLADLLVKMGASISGAGSKRIEIQGVDRLTGTEHAVIPDRVEAGTYLVAGALLGTSVTIAHCRPEHLAAVRVHLEKAGVEVDVDERGGALRVRRPEKVRPISVETSPYPGFPTDMQAQLMVLLTQAAGESTITESIFENRFMHVAELGRMGAHIDLSARTATIKGRTPLTGAEVMATDLRASASLVLAALAASGESVIHRAYHLDRGYEHIEEKLHGLGASIERVVDS